MAAYHRQKVEQSGVKGITRPKRDRYCSGGFPSSIWTPKAGSKGRLAIPARYRERLQSCCDAHLVITVDRDHCLLIYPEPTWIEIERKLDQLPSFNEQARMLQRLYIGHAQEVDMDSQGRVLLAPALRSFASLDKRVSLVGQGKKFELWDEETWNGNCNEWLNQADLSQVESGSDIASLNI